MSKKDSYFIPENMVKENTYEFWGMYSLTIQHYRTHAGAWNYTRGIVTNAEGTIIADIKRNYSSFWYCCILHPSGNHYLLCGEDYQGQTIVELNTGARVDYLPPEAAKGNGFCWAICEWEPDDPYRLKVSGCYWAGPYEEVIYDFTQPMQLPYPEISRSYEMPEDDDDEEEGNGN